MTPRDRRTFEWLRERRRRLVVHGPVPALGSAEFDQLSPDNPAKLVAVLIAAEAWWREGLPERIAERLHDELAVAAQLEQRAFEKVARDVRRRANSPTWSQIRDRWAS